MKNKKSVFLFFLLPTQKTAKYMDCYTTELVDECARPMLTSVPCAYVLTMHPTETFRWLHGVAARTYVQRNRGFGACPKTRDGGAAVTASNQDIVHAYKRVFARVDPSAPVLVFEDDARLTANAREDLAEVDRFVATEPFTVYTLGSLCAMVPFNGSHWRIPGSFGALHAAIYAPAAARAVVEATGVGPHEHIDAHVVGKLPLKFTFWRPVAWQPFDPKNRSANSMTWCGDCKAGWLDVVHREVAWAYYGALGMESEQGWHRIYFVQKLPFSLGILLLALIAGYVSFRLTVP